jgi:hypothetical protein
VKSDDFLNGRGRQYSQRLLERFWLLALSSGEMRQKLNEANGSIFSPELNPSQNVLRMGYWRRSLLQEETINMSHFYPRISVSQRNNAERPVPYRFG